MKRLFASVFLFVFALPAAGQSVRTDFDLAGFGVKIEADERLIAVRTALELAGIRTELTEEGESFRNKVREDFKDLNPELRERLRIFVDQYRRRHPNLSTAELASPFVSMAFSLSPIPDLKEPQRSIELPDSLLEVLDFSPLVRELYKTKGTAAKIGAYKQEYDDEVARLVPSAREMIRDLLDYLHTRPQLTYIDRVKVEHGVGKKKLYKYEPVERQRTFTIVPDLLASKGNLDFLNIRDDYIAIVPPLTDVSSSDVRRAYLQYTLDPLVLEEAREIMLHAEAIRSTLSNQKLDTIRRSDDPVLTVSRSLVAAVDIREEQFRKDRLATDQARRAIVLMKSDEEKLRVSSELSRVKAELSDETVLRLSESYERGALFAYYFAEKLEGIEEAGFDIASSMRPWMAGLDPKAEASRLEENRVTSQRAVLARERRKTEKGTPLVENPLTTALLKVDDSVKAKRFVEAEKRLYELLGEYSENTVETARIFYSLGRVNSLVAEDTEDKEEVGLILEKAANNYKEVLKRAAPNDRALISSAYFALGRIYEHFNLNDSALKIYDAALRIGNVSGGAFEEAFEAKKNLLARKSN